ncbi:magnesium/cobalt transporter CorA [Verrucomicrobiota bacterium]
MTHDTFFMSRIMKKHSGKAGLPPGTLSYVGEAPEEQATIMLMDYDKDGVREKELSDVEECRAYLDKEGVTWINVVGLHDEKTLTGIGDLFGLHPLVLEDIAHTGQRPKTEDHGDHIFVIFKILRPAPKDGVIAVEQVSMVIGRHYVLSFKERKGDMFGAIRDRIRDGRGRIRGEGTDYLAYALLDAVVDHYFVVLEDMGDRIEALQEKVLSDPDPKILRMLHRMRSRAVLARKSIWPLREAVNELANSESDLMVKTTAPYLKDVHEHVIQAIDILESLRDMLSAAFDIHLATASNRMNEIMKVLTLIATIFIPLTFIAGIYGMNFEYMPELKWRCGYLGAWLVMIIIGLGLWSFFKRQKWL